MEKSVTASHNDQYVSTPLTPAEIMADVVKRQLVHRVCTAYESGMGRGLSGRDLSQPYEPTCEEGIAYELGWYQGRGRAAP
jgi:hypothetical protein